MPVSALCHHLCTWMRDRIACLQGLLNVLYADVGAHIVHASILYNQFTTHGINVTVRLVTSQHLFSAISTDWIGLGEDDIYFLFFLLLLIGSL